MGGRFRWLFGLLVLALVAMVGVYAYNLGVAQGLAESARLTNTNGTTPIAYWPYPWHYGIGFFPFGPLLFIFLWFLLLGGLFRRGAWGPGRRYSYGAVPPAFDEWHRQAHAREGQTPASPDSKV
jgi:hypothetical protein